MMRILSVSFAMLFVFACDDGAGGGDEPPGDAGIDSGTVPFGYQSFTPKTRSVGDADGHFQMSVTDTIGTIACGLPQDHKNGLGTSGHQIIANVAYVAGYPCPTGTHSMHSGCEAPDEFWANVPEGCAYYRRFNAQGQALGLLAATAGAITVTESASSCTYTVNLSFNGQAYADTFSLTNLLGPSPWCKQ